MKRIVLLAIAWTLRRLAGLPLGLARALADEADSLERRAEP